MSRRKVRGLTRTGRQVSEDPDLDNLLSTLSPEEMEELEKDMMKVPDLNPEDGKIIVQGESQAAQPPTNNNVRDAKLDSRRETDTKGRLSQREQSFEGELKKESRKQEYLRKMGLSQEGNDDIKVGLQRQASVSSDRDAKVDDRSSKGRESSKEERSRLSSRYRKQDSKDSEEASEKEKCEDNRLRDRRENRESTGSKTKDMISKLQEKKEDSREKERREDCRRRDDSKTKDIISKLREKSEKDVAKEKERKSESIRTQGLVSKMVEKQSKTQESQENKSEEKKPKAEEKKAEGKNKPDVKLERQPSEKGEVQAKHDNAEKRTDREELVNHSDHVKEKEKRISTEKKVEEKKEKGDSKVKNADKSEKLGNCVAKNTPNSKAKQEEEEDEESSMFDELMEQVRNNDPSLTELNVNNSEVIKTKTLIAFAEALHNNTHVKTFALANCRADDHVAYAIAGTIRSNKTITSINLDSNHLTGKGILSLIQALQHNSTLTELRFQNQRHICGGKTEMEMIKILKENTTLLKLGYHFELAGPRMTTTNILSRNMDRQRQKRLQEQKQAQANGEKKGTLEVPKTGGGGSLRGSPRASPKPSPIPSPMPSPKLTPKRGAGGAAPPPPPPPPGGGPPPPPPPMLDEYSLKNSLTPGGSKNSRDQLLASIRGSNIKQLKKVPVPKWLQ
ncbi:leiomodin-1 [Toxotes jaculatrix]|uniref:leiomodin-1 n=1 Tax=Toxotes jaculatrix TaxID=941984 RepID=UPI001B3AEE9C|nr:leiomodin-1 [Toxotes jaculatrix]XP_040889341.1 leiomodin-1 [Toxotes jaculatrix]